MLKILSYKRKMVRCCNDFTLSDGLQIDNFESISMGGIQLDNFEDTTFSGILLDNFEIISNWILSGTGSSYQIDTINYIEGTQGIRVNAIGGNRANVDKILSNNDFSLTQNFAIWLYIYDVTTISSITLYITSTGSAYTKYFSISSSSLGILKSGWNKLVFNKSNFVSTGGEVWTNLMNRIRISIWPVAGQSTSATLDNLRYDVINDWIVGGQGSSIQSDIVNYIEGSQGLKINTINGNLATIDKVLLNKDFSITQNFGIWIYLDSINIGTFDIIRMYFTSIGSSWSKYFSSSISGTNLKIGWNKLIFDKSAFVSTGGEVWTNLMNRIRITIIPKALQNSIVTIDDLRYDVNFDRFVSGIGASAEPDFINYKEGNQAIKLISTNGNTANIDIILGGKDFSSTNNFIIWAFVENADNLSSLRIYLTSTGALWSKYFQDAIYRFRTGWNRIIFNKHNFSNFNTESWTNIFNRIRINITPKPLLNTSVTFDDLRYNISGKRAKLMIHFDDGELNTYTKAFPILSGNNQKGVSFVVISYIGQSNFMTTDNLITLREAGWDISSHSVTHPDLRTLDDATLTYEMKTSYEWLRDNGFHKSSGFIAYPFGYFNDNVLNKAQQYFVMGRSTITESAQQYISSTDNSIQYIQRVIDIGRDTTVQSVIDQIEDAINAKLLTILVLHTIADTNPTNDLYTTLTPDLIAISNYIKSREADIDVITYSDYTIYDCIDIIPNLQVL